MLPRPAQPGRIVREAVAAGATTHAGSCQELPAVKPLHEFVREADSEETSADWLVDGYVARGVVTMIGGFGKAGKSTFCMHLGLAVAQGLPFLGRPTRQTRVLFVNLERAERLTRWKLRTICGDAGDPNFLVVSGTREELTPAVLLRIVQDYDIGLVILDSLSKWWTVEEENAAVETDRGVDPAMRLARNTNSAVLVIHHTRQSGRKPGESVLAQLRGSTAVANTIDIGIIFSKVKDDTQLRKLEAESVYDETPREHYVNLGDDGTYHAIDCKAVEAEQKAEKYTQEREQVATLLVREWLTVEQLDVKCKVARLKFGKGILRDRLKELVVAGRAEREKRGKPYVYRLPQDSI